MCLKIVLVVKKFWKSVKIWHIYVIDVSLGCLLSFAHVAGYFIYWRGNPNEQIKNKICMRSHEVYPAITTCAKFWSKISGIHTWGQIFVFPGRILTWTFCPPLPKFYRGRKMRNVASIFGLSRIWVEVCMMREFPWVPWESHLNGQHRLNPWKWEREREWEWWTENGREMGIVVWKKFPLDNELP